ncbi:MAG: SRPBCC family protein [Actinomycetota bacterium]
MKGSATSETGGRAEAIWALLSDVTRMGEWSPECYRCEWLDGKNGAEVGARFRGHNRWGPLRWSTVSEVVSCEPGREFGFLARHWTGATTRWMYRLEANGTGTRITETYETVDTPRWIMTLERLMQRQDRLARGMRATLEQLGRVAEKMS